MNAIKTIVAVVIVFVIAGLVRYGVESALSKPSKPPHTMTREEYLRLAVKNCSSEDLTESFCSCFYGRMLDNHTVKEVFEFDAAYMANPETYQYTDEQTKLAARCVEEGTLYE